MTREKAKAIIDFVEKFGKQGINVSLNLSAVRWWGEGKNLQRMIPNCLWQDVDETDNMCGQNYRIVDNSETMQVEHEYLCTDTNVVLKLFVKDKMLNALWISDTSSEETKWLKVTQRDLEEAIKETLQLIEEQKWS